MEGRVQVIMNIDRHGLTIEIGPRGKVYRKRVLVAAKKNLLWMDLIEMVPTESTGGCTYLKNKGLRTMVIHLEDLLESTTFEERQEKIRITFSDQHFGSTTSSMRDQKDGGRKKDE